MALCLNLQLIAKNNQQQLVKFMAGFFWKFGEFKVVKSMEDRRITTSHLEYPKSGSHIETGSSSLAFQEPFWFENREQCNLKLKAFNPGVSNNFKTTRMTATDETKDKILDRSS